MKPLLRLLFTTLLCSLLLVSCGKNDPAAALASSGSPSEQAEPTESAKTALRVETTAPDVTDSTGQMQSPVPEKNAFVPRVSRDQDSRALRSLLSVDVDTIREEIIDRYQLQQLEDPIKEIEYLKDRYAAGDTSVATDLALMLAYASDDPADIALAKRILLENANAGDAHAQAELGRLYLTGNQLIADPQAAVDLLLPAAEAGDPEAAFILGAAYRLGLVPDYDQDQGLSLLQSAASLGQSEAVHSILHILLQDNQAVDGKSYKQITSDFRALAEDYPDLGRWLVAAAENGDAYDYYQLGLFYNETGDREKSLASYRAAAQLGSYDALNKLVKSDRNVLQDPAYRAEIEELIQLHLDTTDAQLEEAYFILASLQLLDSDQEGYTQRAIASLEEGLANHDWRAGIALLKIQSGENPMQAIIAAMKPSRDDVYEAYQIVEDEIQNTAQSDHGPVPIKLGTIVYPPELYSMSIKGEVMLEMVIDDEGRVARSEVLRSSHPAFEPYALQLIQDAEFKPARKDGKPVASKVILPVHFSPAQ